MSAAVVTFTNQLGAGGFDIGRQVAARLGLRHCDWEVTAQAAEGAGISPEVVAANAERVPTFLERMLERLASGATEDPEMGSTMSRATMVETALTALTSDAYRHFIELVVKDLARDGGVLIVGHAAQVILRDHPGVLRVLIHGSARKRATRIAQAREQPIDQMLALVQESDRQRSRFFRNAYKIDWLSASLYDLAIATDRIELEAAVDLVVNAATALSSVSGEPLNF